MNMSSNKPFAKPLVHRGVFPIPKPSIMAVFAAKLRRNKKKAYRIPDLTQLAKQISGPAWTTLRAIGDTGDFWYSPILKRASEMWEGSSYQQLFIDAGKSARLSSAQVNKALSDLVGLGAVDRENPHTVLKPSAIVYRLTSIGCQLYREEFGNSPKESKLDNVAENHDDLYSGLLVLEVTEMLEKSRFFESVVSSKEGKKKLLGSRNACVPDVFATDGKCVSIFKCMSEPCSQSKLDRILDSMLETTNCIDSNYINVVVRNKDLLLQMKNQVEVWIIHRGGVKTLDSKAIRLSTPTLLKNTDPHDTSKWLFVYDNNSDEPTAYGFG